MASKKRTAVCLGIAFVLPVLLMVLVYGKLGIYPLGTADKNLMTIDMSNQYINFYAYLKKIFTGEHSLFYSFSTTLGGNISGLSAYYLMSPLNLLLFFFSTEQLPMAVVLITLIKIGLCGLTFYILIAGRECPWQGWIFSTAYALMAYNMVWQLNLMWLDGVILLPLVVLGIRWICRKKSPFLYMFTLFLAILSDYYIGFMLCIFSVLFFLYQYFCGEKREKLRDVSILGTYVLSSVLAGGLSMWLLLPALQSLAGGKAVFSLSSLTLAPNFHWSDFFVKPFVGSFSYRQASRGLPNVYCGAAVLVFLGFFFLSGTVALRKKLGAALLFGVMLVSFYINGLNLIWHGFNPPTWYPYRYSFLFSFLMLYFGWIGFQAVRVFSARRLLASGVFLAAGYLLLVSLVQRKGFEFMSMKDYAMAVGCLLAILCLTMQVGKRLEAVCMAVVLLITCGEMAYNGWKGLSVYSYREKGAFESFVAENAPVIDYLMEKDEGFYRIEKDFQLTDNDPMLLDYMGASHFSSSERTDVKAYMKQAGYCSNGNWVRYNGGSTYAMDSLLGIRYVYSEKKMSAPYKFLEQVGKFYVYENPYALSMGIPVSEKSLDFSWEEGDKFAFQNRLWEALAPEVGKPLFIREPEPECVLHNLQPQKEEGTYVKEVDGKEASVEYVFTAQSEDSVFAYIDGKELRDASLFVNGEKLGSYLSMFSHDIICLGRFRKGERVEIRLSIPENSDKQEIQVSSAQFYYQDMDVWKEYYEKMSGNVTVEKLSDTRLKGTFSNKDGKPWLLFTIPHDENWKVTVDGESVRTAECGGIFLGAAVPEGEHEIALSYAVPGLKTGVIISAVSALLALAWGLDRRRKNCEKPLIDGRHKERYNTV